MDNHFKKCFSISFSFDGCSYNQVALKFTSQIWSSERNIHNIFSFFWFFVLYNFTCHWPYRGLVVMVRLMKLKPYLKTGVVLPMGLTDDNTCILLLSVYLIVVYTFIFIAYFLVKQLDLEMYIHILVSWYHVSIFYLLCLRLCKCMVHA